MRFLLSRLSVLILGLLLMATSMADERLRCGGQLIEPGMSRAEVLSLCGEPTARAVEVQDVRSGNQVVGKTEMHRWTYTSYSATRVLVFDHETLKAIE